MFRSKLLDNKITSNNLSANLNFLIKKNGIDLTTLRDATRINLSTLNSLKQPGANPTLMTLQPLADFFGVSIDNLVNGNCSDIESNVIRRQSILIPIISLEDLKTDNKKTEKHVTVELTPSQQQKYSDLYGIEVDTEILMPRFEKNTFFVFSTSINPSDKDIVIVSLGDDNAITYREILVDGSTFYFRPINPEFGTMRTYNNYKIYGTVIKAIKNIKN